VSVDAALVQANIGFLRLEARQYGRRCPLPAGRSRNQDRRGSGASRR
jgi:hypothetical protein